MRCKRQQIRELQNPIKAKTQARLNIKLGDKHLIAKPDRRSVRPREKIYTDHRVSEILLLLHRGDGDVR